MFHRVERDRKSKNKLEANVSVTIGVDIPDAVFVSKNFKGDLKKHQGQADHSYKEQCCLGD